MKWWGWGDEGVEFTHSDKPKLAPFVREHIGVDLDLPQELNPSFADLELPESQLTPKLREALEQIVSPQGLSDSPLDRVVHARGKSLRDLIRQRRGEFPRLPDVVVRPSDESQVSGLMRVALEADAVLIAFGGGTSISGSLEPEPEETRPVISVDLSLLNHVLEIDAHSRLARVQAGILGPQLEEQLAAQGYTLGHFPDSFNHSTLGGWIATRSSGMQSDAYGDIADLTRGLRVVTPSGMLVVKPVPAASNGPSVREMVLGSEGRLGVITEATIKVRQLPEARRILGYLFPSFSDGLAAMRDIAASECQVSVSRLADAAETKFTFATRRNPNALDQVKSKALTTFLERGRGFKTDEMCLAFIGFEGSRRSVETQRLAAGAIVKRHGGVCIGAGPGQLYDQKKFDTPYIRDFLLDRGVVADVSETATTWSGLEPLHDAVVAAGQATFEHLGVTGYLMCHMSHSYHGGACLYFTFAFEPTDPDQALEQYDAVKRAIQQAFVDNGATLSHHHAVGTEHSLWLEADITAPGVAMLEGLFGGVDPGRNLNPGKIT